MAKIDGVDEGDEAEGAGRREYFDDREEFGNRRVVRKHDLRQPSQQEKEEHIFRFAVGAGTALWREDEKNTVASR